MTDPRLMLSVLKGTFAVCRLESDDPIPAWALAGGFVSITRTGEELSIVAPQADVPDGTKCVRGWSCLKLEGSFDLSSIGVLASVMGPLAQEGISVLALSTFETDYLLVKGEDLEQAIRVLSEAGYPVRRRQGA
ncbi:MAG TPA: ACT domain-containing protein [Candidatus Methylomirabilis sp.]|nr:ACT domain-containing protein [Candidatus Methylomirabilis sp.]